MVLLELLTAAKVIDNTRRDDCYHLVHWCKDAMGDHNIEAVREVRPYTLR